MTLAEQLAAAREKLGKGIKDARDLAAKHQTSKLAEDFEAYKRAEKDATELAMDVQRLQGDITLSAHESLIDPPAPTSREQFTQPLPSGDWERSLPKLTKRDQFANGSRVISDKEYAKIFGITKEAHQAAFGTFLRLGASYDLSAVYRACATAAAQEMNQKPSEQHIHKIVDDTLGGFLVSEDFRAQVIRALPGYTVVRRAGARVLNTSKPSITIPVVNRAATNVKQYTSGMNQGDTNWKTEAFTTGGTARTPQNQPTFGKEEVPVHIWQPDPVEITRELMDDSDIDLDGLIVELFAETMGMDTDLAFLRGNGVGKPEGILNSGAAEVTIASAATYATPTQPASGPDNGFSYRRVVDMAMGLAAQYRQNASWIMNSDTFGRLLWLAGSDGHPLFPINAMPGTLLTRPMYFTEFLDSGATQNNFPVIFGDMKYFVIAERRAMGIMRLVERYAPNIAILPTARIGGQVVLTEAFRLGKVAA